MTENKSRNSGNVLARFVMEYLLRNYNEKFPLDLCHAIHDYSISNTWIIGINFIQNNLKKFPKEFIFDSYIEPPNHVALLINDNQEAIYIKHSIKLEDEDIICDNHYLIFDGNDYNIKQYSIKNWRLK